MNSEQQNISQTSDTASLVLEIGCEEIPARFVAGAEHELGERITAALRNAHLLDSHRPVTTASTPRRLVAYVPALLARQPDRLHRVLGPSAKAAFDQHGRPTRAAEAFAAKHGLQVSDLSRIHQTKGEYVVAELQEDGSKAFEVVRELLPQVVGSLSFPQNMYWTSKAGPRFVRPIRWILALLKEADKVEVVPFEFAGVSSGSHTFGHRFKGSRPLELQDLDLDLKLMEHLVVLHSGMRRRRIQEQIKALVEDRDWAVARDEFLEDWVVNSTEWPVALMGRFDRRYLALPREVLITVMRGHQKYFAVEDKVGSLQPHFVTVLNVPGDAKGLIRQGHERVLAARFADAEFFWRADQKISLADRIPMLERAIYHDKIGTYGDKVRRMRNLAREICGQLEKSETFSVRQRQHALRAIDLCKCDLTTQMVQELTELQGVVGGLYARTQGEPEGVADAIYDHYKPVSVDDSCPRSVAGAVVSLADKLDAVIAGFAVGLEPTGSSDPFALRRAGNGVVRLAAEVLTELNVTSAIEGFLQAWQSGLSVCVEAGLGRAELSRKVDAFLRERMEFYCRELAGLRYDTVRAVLRSARHLEHFVPSDALARAKALEGIRDTADFLALAAAAKRTRNIRKSAREADLDSADPDPARFTEVPERDLYEAYQNLRQRIHILSAAGDYQEAFRVMATIRPPVDRFFDKVLVMADNPELRRNRLRLLLRLNEDVFTSLADLGEIAVESRAGVAKDA